jgi:LuxR family transcriptional regulator, regulator of acetate metabolism
VAAPGEPLGLRGLERVVDGLQQLERELIEVEYVRREDALERIGDAIRGLSEIGSAEGILERTAEALGTSAPFDRVLISEVLDASLRPSAIWAREDPAAAQSALATLRRSPVKLEYPLLEAELVSRPRAELVDVGSARSRTPLALVETFGWDSYVVAALAVGAHTVALLHADRSASRRPLEALDRELAARFSEGLAGVFERAVLRETLSRHRSELQSAVQWMSGRLARIAADQSPEDPAAAAGTSRRAVDALTRRELEVLRLMARGQRNLAIANTLLVREGTVKYHVKNILRKLGARSRADAVARYVRATGSPIER